MSPKIVPLERKDPSQFLGRRGDETGTIAATGSPERVIRTGWPLRCTFSRTLTHSLGSARAHRTLSGGADEVPTNITL
jgi:hypothetical protein